MTARAAAVGAVFLLTCAACESTDRPRSAQATPARPLDSPLRMAASPTPSARPLQPAPVASTPSPGISPAAASRSVVSEEPSPQGPPAGTLAPPRPTDPPTHATVTVADLAKHVGESLRFQMKDGRILLGTLRSVDNGTVKLEREMGLGTSVFQLRLADVDQVLKRLE